MGERRLLRVYRCPRCRNVGYAPVENFQDSSVCSLCQAKIPHSSSTRYAATVEEAESMIRELVVDSTQRSLPGGDPRSYGVRKRVLNIVEALVDTNRGRPVSIMRILQECSDAGIDEDKASAFIDAMLSDGCLVNDGSEITLSRRKGTYVRY